MRRRRRVAFVGLGHVGSHMCRHVCTYGHRVTAFDLDRKAVARATRTGARSAPSVAECVADAEILITSLPGPAEVEQVLCGPQGAVAALSVGAIVVEMSTSSLEVGRIAVAAARRQGCDFVDAPVAGQTIRAEAGTLSIYAGGSRKAFGRALPVLETIGDPARSSISGPAAAATRSSSC
jgi:3-hydroxyisobutyrate dehydrogenase